MLPLRVELYLINIGVCSTVVFSKLLDNNLRQKFHKAVSVLFVNTFLTFLVNTVVSVFVLDIWTF